MPLEYIEKNSVQETLICERLNYDFSELEKRKIHFI